MVPGRSCDGCVVCCVVPPVKSPEFSKTSGVACQHCDTAAGCAIYATRPNVCREFLCGWRSLPFLDDRWKPEACGLLVLPDKNDIPLDFERRVGLAIIAFRARGDLQHRFVVEMLAGLVAGKAPVFLSVPGPPGFDFAKTLLNPLLDQAVEARDGQRIEAVLTSTYDRLAGGSFRPLPA
ncbi:MAG: hypothetical protein GC155_11530 [Alphaproteobacteria bacterium]|nr:hypothetical protein [Alphaproteobacteria bacterium]